MAFVSDPITGNIYQDASVKAQFLEYTPGPNLWQIFDVFTRSKTDSSGILGIVSGRYKYSNYRVALDKDLVGYTVSPCTLGGLGSDQEAPIHYTF